jgi:pimeloyl-ACP methyl ester carboxylesterase
MSIHKIITRLFIIGVALFIFTDCHKEEITLGNNASDYFYVERKGASMFTLVKGNTASKVFLLIVHGGPGDTGLSYSDAYIRSTIEPNYAVVYCDQRDASSSQGGDNQENITLDNMVEDYLSLITVLKQRYGTDIEIFMMSHSFGGLVSAAFMTSNDNQSLIKGLIYVDGAFDYPLNDSLTRVRLLAEGDRQISMGKYTAEWNEILDFCHEHTGPFTFDESMKLNLYAWKGQSYMEEIHKSEDKVYLYSDGPETRIPLTASLLNSLANSEFAENILNASYTNQLNKVTLPVLIIYGKYDMVCPKELGEELYRLIGSTDKELVISEVSAHSPMDEDREFFYDKVITFIERIK